MQSLAGKTMLASRPIRRKRRLMPTLAGNIALVRWIMPRLIHQEYRLIPVSCIILPQDIIFGKGHTLLPTGPGWKRNRILQIRCPTKMLLGIRGLARSGRKLFGRSCIRCTRTTHGITFDWKTFRQVSNPSVPNGSSRPNNYLEVEFGTRQDWLYEALNRFPEWTSMKLSLR